MAIKAIIFDCFGVLTTDGWLPFRDTYFKGDPELMEHAKELNRQVDAGAISYPSFVSKVANMANVTEGLVKNALGGHVRNDQLIDYIEAHLKSKYKIGLLSNVSGDFIDEIIGSKATRLFDEIVLSYQVGAVKPNRIMYDTIVTKLGIKHSECVFIDDQLAYCEGARTLGIKTILFKNNEQALAELEKALR